MPTLMKIDVVSDVVCPWCAIGLASLQAALARLDGVVEAELRVLPFELNPQMGPEGEDIVEHLSRKYRISAKQIEQNRAAIAARGAALGVRFGARSRTWNTFDAHRLLHWAGELGAAEQLRLKQRLLEAYHGDGENVSDPSVLLRLATEAGLDADAAWAVLDSDAHAGAVRALEAEAQDAGITSVPAVIIGQRYLISGGQPPEVFEQALRRIAEEQAAAPAT